MEKEFIHGRMVDDMKESTSSTKSTVMEFMFGQMEEVNTLMNVEYEGQWAYGK